MGTTPVHVSFIHVRNTPNIGHCPHLKDNLPHNTYQIYVKPHLKNTQMTLEYQIFDEKALEQAVCFLDFRSPKHFHGGMHGGSHWIARALFEIGDVQVEQWLNLRWLNIRMGRHETKERQQKRRSWNDSNGSLHAFFAGTHWRPKIK